VCALHVHACVLDLRIMPAAGYFGLFHNHPSVPCPALIPRWHISVSSPYTGLLLPFPAHTLSCVRLWFSCFIWFLYKLLRPYRCILCPENQERHNFTSSSRKLSTVNEIWLRKNWWFLTFYLGLRINKMVLCLCFLNCMIKSAAQVS